MLSIWHESGYRAPESLPRGQKDKPSWYQVRPGMPTNHESQAEQSPLRLYHHYWYILFWMLLGSLILYIPGGLPFVDALLLASGAATQSGLNPVDLNRLHLVQQITLWMVPMATNVIFLNTLVVLIRLYWFRNRFQRVIDEAKVMCRTQRRHWSQELSRQEFEESMEMNRSLGSVISERMSQEQTLLDNGNPRMQTKVSSRPQTARSSVSSTASLHITFDEPGGCHESKNHKRSYSYLSQSQIDASEQRSYGDLEQQRGHHDLSYLPALIWQQSIASYSDWNERQKDELGGIEYRALKTLLIILISYFFAFHLLGLLLFLLWVYSTQQFSDTFVDANVSRGWWAIFTSGSAFNDLGYTLTPNSMEPFRTAPVLLLTMTFLIVVGNTGFPCMLRFIIWILSKFTLCGSALEEELRYLLDHPRRCFTLLFPAAETWRLAAVLLLLNAIDLAIFWALEATPQAGDKITMPLELVNGLFQIASTRTAGFTIMPLSRLHPGVQVSFIVMMYISAFPTAIAMRKTNIYEEQSLGIYEDHEFSKSSHSQGLSDHIQRQLGFDLWYIMLGFFTIAVVEGNRLQQNRGKPDFSLFNVLFEIVSAYGTVGLSLGYPGTDKSLCGEFSAISKLVIIAMQVRGRHRGLPHAVDHAILLPNELGEQDQEGDDWWWKRWLRKRRSTIGSFFSQREPTNTGENGWVI